jgi:hypothetical protein
MRIGIFLEWNDLQLRAANRKTTWFMIIDSRAGCLFPHFVICRPLSKQHVGRFGAALMQRVMQSTMTRLSQGHILQFI